MMLRRFATAAVLAAVASGPALAEKITIKVANFTPPQGVSVRDVYIPFMKQVEQEVGDEVAMQGYWGGSLGRNPNRQYDLAKSGVADMVFVVPGYTPGQFPDYSAFELPYFINNAAEGSVALWKMYEKKMLGGTEEVHMLGAFTTEPYGFHTRNPVKSLEGMKGLKIRAAGPIQGATAKSLGAVAVGMAATGVAEDLSRGVVDGAMYSWSGMFVFRIHQVAKHHFMGPFGVAPFITVMNQATWNKLSPKAKAVFNKYGGAHMARIGGVAFDANGDVGKKAVQQMPDATIVELTPAQIEEAQKLAQPIYEEWVSSHEGGQTKLDTLRKTMAEVRAEMK